MINDGHPSRVGLVLLSQPRMEPGLLDDQPSRLDYVRTIGTTGKTAAPGSPPLQTGEQPHSDIPSRTYNVLPGLLLQLHGKQLPYIQPANLQFQRFTIQIAIVAISFDGPLLTG